MKNAYLPKTSILLQFGSEILALLCPGDSIQILLILSQFQTLRTDTKLEGFVWNHLHDCERNFGITGVKSVVEGRNSVLLDNRKAVVNISFPNPWWD